HYSVQLHLNIPCPPPKDNSLTACLIHLTSLSVLNSNFKVQLGTKSNMFLENRWTSTPASHTSSHVLSIYFLEYWFH
ncbi:unnamed protein product, partial [Brachionus calyciflorus]